MNLLNNYTRLLTSVLFEDKVFENVLNSKPDGIGFASVVRDRIYVMAIEAVWDLYFIRIQKHDILVHVECDLPNRKFRSVIFIKIKLYNRLFGNLVPGQQMKELARLINGLMDAIDGIDWPQFVLDIEEEN